MQLVVVVGVGRSGTSAFTGALAQLGYAVPQPEVTADETNPRGFGEPQWLVDFQTSLLRRAAAANWDGRPEVAELLQPVADDPEVVTTLRAWLQDQLAACDRVVVKDPRTTLLLPLWLRASSDLGVVPRFVTVLRHPAAVVASARSAYGEGRSDSARAGGWVNVQLHGEAVTRSHRRAFVRYDDLLSDWRQTIQRMDATLQLGVDVGAAGAARIDEFLDPQLRREQPSWGALDVQARVRDLADRTWTALTALADGQAPSPVQSLDACRRDYDALYAEAAAITEWSVAAARAGAKAARRAGRNRSL